MIGLRQLLRLAYINVVLVRHGLDDIVLGTHLLRPIRFLLYLLPWNWVRGTRPPRAVRWRVRRRRTAMAARARRGPTCSFAGWRI